MLAAHRCWLIAAALVCLAAPEVRAQAQGQTQGQGDVAERQVKVAPGHDERVGVYTNIKSDCTGGPLPAIRLLVASKAQGKFEPVLDALFERQEEWASHQAPNIPHIGKIATDVGVDLPKARVDAASPAATAVLQQDNEDIVALKVERTPTFYVNGRSLDDFGPEQLLGLVREEVEKTKK